MHFAHGKCKFKYKLNTIIEPKNLKNVYLTLSEGTERDKWNNNIKLRNFDD